MLRRGAPPIKSADHIRGRVRSTACHNSASGPAGRVRQKSTMARGARELASCAATRSSDSSPNGSSIATRPALPGDGPGLDRGLRHAAGRRRGRRRRAAGRALPRRRPRHRRGARAQALVPLPARADLAPPRAGRQRAITARRRRHPGAGAPGAHGGAPGHVQPLRRRLRRRRPCGGPAGDLRHHADDRRRRPATAPRGWPAARSMGCTGRSPPAWSSTADRSVPAAAPLTATLAFWRSWPSQPSWRPSRSGRSCAGLSGCGSNAGTGADGTARPPPPRSTGPARRAGWRRSQFGSGRTGPGEHRGRPPPGRDPGLAVVLGARDADDVVPQRLQATELDAIEIAAERLVADHPAVEILHRRLEHPPGP
jgi:hypothetical protein